MLKKFRVWVKDNILHKGSKGHYIELYGGTLGVNEYGEFTYSFDEDVYSNDEMIVEQFTGLSDKNNKEIYEGDIVNFNGKIVTIEWNEAEALFWGGSNDQRYIFQYCDMLQIVGNINENPELLES